MQLLAYFGVNGCRGGGGTKGLVHNVPREISTLCNSNCNEKQ